ncbi:MAG: transcriptional repressor [Gammaproteobacteria bacterium]|nr:transcriptional repressor [Gammaproteobacteria bacterium]
MLEITKLLRSHGITPTVQRMKIATAMFDKPQHLSADQVLELTNREGKRVSKATIYNTLGLFAKKGLIRELVIDPQRTFYDSSTHNHHHYYNPETQELFDVEPGLLDIKLAGELPEGVEIDKLEVVVHLRSSASA